MKMPSASMLQRAIACPGSLALPQSILETSDSAQRGTEIHSYLASKTDETQQILELTEATAEYVDRIDISQAIRDRTPIYTERTFLLYPTAESESVRLLESGEKIDYRNSEEFIGGTVDLILQESDGTYVILDWKSGTSVEHPKENKQLLFFAYCLWKYLQQKNRETNFSVAGEIAFLDPVSGKITVVRAEYSIEQLQGFYSSLCVALTQAKTIDQLLRKGQPIPINASIAAGGHCKYCPSFQLCPKQRHIAQSLAAGVIRGLIPSKGYTGMMSPEEAGAAWMRLKEIRKVLAVAEAELRAYAEDIPLELPNGGTVSVISSTRESIVPKIAKEVLIEKGGQPLWDACSTQSISKASLKRGLTQRGLPSKKKDTDIVLEMIADRGGVLVTTGVRLKQILPTGQEAQLEEDSE